MIRFTVLVLSLLFSACGPAYHLKRAQAHLKKAEQKGAKVDRDTVYRIVEVIRPEIKTDTVFTSLPGDTVRIVKDKLSIKYVKLPGDSVFIEGKCDPDTVKISVPYTVTTNITAESKIKWWHLVVALLAGGLVVRLFGNLK
jgi:hypothetical protein